ncbi:MAG: glycosyltransferase, partial [Flaviflexus sp.]|nr:glycosyltransferase [Flaviflexus sp.]
MRALISLASSQEEAARVAEHLEPTEGWELHVVSRAKIRPPSSGQAYRFHRADHPLAQALTLAGSFEAAWIMRPEARPTAGAIPAIDLWLSERDAEALYGDTMGPGGLPLPRPRLGRMRMASSGDIGSSIILTQDASRTLANDVELSGDLDLAWYRLALAVADMRTEHLPVEIEVTRSLPGIDPAARARELYPADPQAVRIGDEPCLLPFPAPATSSASIIIPSIGSPASFGDTTRPALLACLESLGPTHLREIIIVAGPAMPASVVEEARRLSPIEPTVVHIDGPFNFSASCNLGAAHATGDILLFLNDDVEALSPDWIEPIIGLAERPEIGAVGARLLFPDGTIQHAGVTVMPTIGEPAHLDYRKHPDSAPLHSRAVSEVLAVTGACLALTADDFAEVGGWCEDLPVNFNDIDLCLKLVQLGRTNVSCNPVTLIHRESTSRDGSVAQEEIDA